MLGLCGGVGSLFWIFRVSYRENYGRGSSGNQDRGSILSRGNGWSEGKLDVRSAVNEGRGVGKIIEIEGG